MKSRNDDPSDDRLDQLLQAAPDITPSAALLRAVAEIPIRHPRPSEVGLSLGSIRRWIAFATAALALGVALGVELPDDRRPGAVSSADDETAWDDLSTLALGADVSEDLLP